MNKLLKSRKTLFILLLILSVSLIDSLLGERFFHGEILRQINETMKTEASRILQGYETYDQNREILRAGIQSDALAFNRIHGDFLISAIEQSHRENLRGKLDGIQMERRIVSVIERSEAAVSLKGILIRNGSAHRNDLDQLIKDAVKGPGQSISYLGNAPSELLHSGALDIIIRGGAEQPWETYARAVYYQPLDMIVIFKGTSSYAEDNVGRLFSRIQGNLERTVMAAGTLDDVIIFQKNGYSLYSGLFEKDNPHRVTRILFREMDDPKGLGKDILGTYDTHKTLMVPTPDGAFQERYCYILYDSRQDHYVVISRPTADIQKREDALIAISRFVGVLNIIAVGLIARMLISRDEALIEEGVNP